MPQLKNLHLTSPAGNTPKLFDLEVSNTSLHNCICYNYDYLLCGSRCTVSSEVFK